MTSPQLMMNALRSFREGLFESTPVLVVFRSLLWDLARRRLYFGDEPEDAWLSSYERNLTLAVSSLQGELRLSRLAKTQDNLVLVADYGCWDDLPRSFCADPTRPSQSRLVQRAAAVVISTGKRLGVPVADLDVAFAPRWKELLLAEPRFVPSLHTNASVYHHPNGAGTRIEWHLVRTAHLAKVKNERRRLVQ